MRLHLKRPTPGTVLGMLALFISLGGTTYAATGGNFIVGQANTATSQTGLTSNNAGKALQVTQSSTGSGATALGLTVPSGKAPFTVNSGTKVAGLNADKLDGIDSLALQKRVTGACSGVNAITSISANGSATCKPAGLRRRLVGGRFPVPSSGWQFITSGGSVLFELACSGFRAAADGGGDIEVGLSADDFAAAVTRVYTNETDSHKATIVSWSDELTLPAGTHTLEFYPLPPTKTDVHDFCNLVILEEPS